MSKMTSKSKSASNFNVLLLGLTNSGKSSLFSVLEGGSKPEEHSPTEGFNLMRYQDPEYSNSSLFVWDLGGRELQRKGWHYFYPATDGIIYVIDSADKSSLKENKSQIESLFKNSKLQRIPIIILANKQDKIGAMNEIELKNILELDNSNRRLWRIFGSSHSSSSSLISSLQVLTNGMEGRNKER